jgi:DNA polymerase-3 subunit epsilon
MTGLNFEAHEITEIGLVLAKHVISEKTGKSDIENIGEFEWKVKPEHIETADPVALKINKYSEDAWKDAFSLTQALTEFTERTEGAILVGHNVAFDYAFLEQGFRTKQIENKMHYHKLDTISLAYAVLYTNNELQKFSLRELCTFYGIENINARSRATFELYRKLLPEF